jgi:hypothetical protein
MVLLTDGRSAIWAAFYMDGCECEDLLGLFDREESAKAVAEKHKLEMHFGRGIAKVTLLEINRVRDVLAEANS